MKQRSQTSSAFSLAEVALALGVAGFAFVAVLGMLPAGLKVQQNSIAQTTATEIMNTIFADLRGYVRLPPGLQKKTQGGQLGLGLNGHWAAVATPQTVFFDDDGKEIANSVSLGTTDPDAPAGAAFRAKLTYLFPPNASTSVGIIFVSWPAQVKPTTGTPAGSVETLIAINR